jgi:hypothetical protein
VADEAPQHGRHYVGLPASYCWLYVQLREAAVANGYALAVHGSMARDLDVVAVPWVEDAAPVETLVEALRDAVAGWIPKPLTAPGLKPHGRLAYTILLEGHAFIDLSVMPPSTVAALTPPPAAPEVPDGE